MSQLRQDIEAKIAQCADLCYRDSKRSGGFFQFNWARGKKFHMPECQQKCTAQYQSELNEAQQTQYLLENATNSALLGDLTGGNGNNNMLYIAAAIAAIIIIMFIL